MEEKKRILYGIIDAMCKISSTFFRRYVIESSDLNPLKRENFWKKVVYWQLAHHYITHLCEVSDFVGELTICLIYIIIAIKS